MGFQLAGTRRRAPSEVIEDDGNRQIRYDLTEGQAIVVTYPLYTEFVNHPVGSGFWIPVSFSYLTTRHALPYVVQLQVGTAPNEEPRVLSLSVSRKQPMEVGESGGRRARSYPAEKSVRSEPLRDVPVGRLLTEALLAASSDSPEHEVPDYLIRSEDVEKSIQSKPSTSQRQPRDDSLLREVAKVYRTAPSEPTNAVMRHFGVARSTAGRYVALAREVGHLHPAPAQGKAGEVK